MSDEEREKRDQEIRERYAETVSQFGIQFGARARDLLNECVEAGYSIPNPLEEFRLEGWAKNTHVMEQVGSGLGIIARRLRRESKKL